MLESVVIIIIKGTYTAELSKSRMAAYVGIVEVKTDAERTFAACRNVIVDLVTLDGK